MDVRFAGRVTASGTDFLIWISHAIRELARLLPYKYMALRVFSRRVDRSFMSTGLATSSP